MSSLFGDTSRFVPVFALVMGALLLLILVASIGMRRAVRGEVDQPGMFGVVGRMGSGKTYLQALMARRALAGTYRLKCEACSRVDGSVCEHTTEGPRPVYANFWVDGARPLASWADALDVPAGSKKDRTTGALVLIDEAQLWWPSSAWNAPADVKAWCAQLRKRRITVIWSSQHQSHVAKRLMQLTFGVWAARQVSGVHVYTLYEPTEFGKAGAKHQARVKFKRRPDVMASYDTEEIIQPACEWDTSGTAGTSGERVRNEHRAGMPAPPTSPFEPNGIAADRRN